METQTTTPDNAPPLPDFSVTEAAAARINLLKAREKNPGLKFRVLVKGGGCSGFQYEFDLSDNITIASDDHVYTHGGAEVVVDEVSLDLLKGSVLDYSEDLASAGFSIKNPNATAKCGCGNSFSVAL
jgi:iron-sulfur cluster insertion protein